MAGFKETPRQKMIGMMYLVLTAMLALNVSAEILNAFSIVDDAVVQTNKNFRGKNNMIYAEFDKQLALNKAKVKPYHDKAMEVKSETEAMIGKIREIQNRVIAYTELGIPAKGDDYKPSPVTYKDPYSKEDKEVTVDEPYMMPVEAFKSGKSNYDKPMEIMLGVGCEDGTCGKANELKLAFEVYKNNLKALLRPADTIDLDLGLKTEDKFNPHAGTRQTWERNTFGQTVLPATVLLLNKYIADVQNVESEILTKLLSNIDAGDFKFDEIDKKVVPNSNIIMQGQDYGSQVFVAAYSSTDTPIVLIKEGVDSVPLTLSENDPGVIKVDSISNGIAHYIRKGAGVGEYKYAGVIKIKGPDGSYKNYNFAKSYQVIRPSATVSATKMNVVYRGLENPLSVSASGYTSNQVSVSSSGGGSLSKKSGSDYVFVPTRGGNADEVTFSVSATDSEGNRASLGSFKYRIKNLPSPTIRLGNTAEGTIDRSSIAATPYLFAPLENFLFEGIKYTVVSFDLYAAHPSAGILANERVRGNKLPAGAIAKLRTAQRGTLISISSVRVSGPDGEKMAGSLTLKVR
jgi:gliding motility-associated protein GldM